MNSALLGLVTALSWGLHDFLARFPSRAVGPVPSVLAVTVSGLIVLSVWYLFAGGSIDIVWPSVWLVAVTGEAASTFTKPSTHAGAVHLCDKCCNPAGGTIRLTHAARDVRV
ncbi:MAG: hypothetical protein FJX44_10465 [Alphaproteobacteria bacterium]|nr:hypothetical protein [Alphaproteobacteria bacterium]